ncbi:MAG: winged helix-turn-helix domain-containing protein [Candidatus Methanomethylicaceae archaeon]
MNYQRLSNLENGFIEMLKIEDVLSSRGTMKILKILSDNEEMNITQISKKAMLNHKNTIIHLEKLIKANIVKERKYGKIRIFKINKDNEISLKIIDLIKTWERKYFFNM